MKKFITGLVTGILACTVPIALADILPPVEFTDVHEGDWYHDVVVDLVNAGYAEGYSDGSFHPNDPITRAETAKLVMKADSFISANKEDILDLENKVSILESKLNTLELPGECYYNETWYAAGDPVDKDLVCEGDMCGAGTCTCQADGTLAECVMSY